MRNHKRLLVNLAAGEIAASVSFILVFIMIRKNMDLGAASVMVFSFLISLLLQGSLYWLVRYSSRQRKTPVTKRIVSLFSFLRWVNVVVCFAIPFPVLSLFRNDIDLYFAGGCYLFSLIEYINYYWYRLSYGRSGFNIYKLLRVGLKKSSMNKLIASNKGKE